ncbi:hypothetical protein LEP1GSC170_4656 [Leptospira interrogans serovar Bataviae str. HAI135]|nr:hypothetical protein LEP1GSC170_4656 [Leptospira interrogans serovar Bataviae str. HAI135]
MNEYNDSTIRKELPEHTRVFMRDSFLKNGVIYIGKGFQN